GIGDHYEIDNPLTTVMINNSDFQDGEDGVYIGDDIDGLGPWLVPTSTNLPPADPLFILTSMVDKSDNYFLANVLTLEPDQPIDSPCVDYVDPVGPPKMEAALLGDINTVIGLAGNPNRVAETGVVTRTDYVPDIPGVVDMGYHYSGLAGLFTLSVTVNANGSLVSISPLQALYNAGEVVTITVAPDFGYRVEAWTGADTYPSSYINSISVQMDDDRDITVDFALDIYNILRVPSEYGDIADAISAAASGDMIIVAPGVYNVSDSGLTN
ncbi:unnamed protein product, partial [marine sediment metagenome]